MWIVTIFSTVVTLVMVNLVEQHVTESEAYASLKGIEFTSRIDGVEVTLADQMDDFIDGQKSLLIILMIMHLTDHWLINRLNSKENNIPRIVDLKASRAKVE